MSVVVQPWTARRLEASGLRPGARKRLTSGLFAIGLRLTSVIPATSSSPRATPSVLPPHPAPAGAREGRGRT